MVKNITSMLVRFSSLLLLFEPLGDLLFRSESRITQHFYANHVLSVGVNELFCPRIWVLNSYGRICLADFAQVASYIT